MTDFGNKKDAVFSVGHCPVCSTSGPVLCLIRIADDQPLYFCPSCETAWPSLPVFPVLDSVASVETLAPGGVRLPTHAEVKRYAEEIRTVPYADWKGELDAILIRPS